MTPANAHVLRRSATTSIAAVIAGFFAGTLASITQTLTWWLSGTPVLETLLRDARLTAALVMGRSLLASEPRWDWEVLLVATLIHYGLSAAYAAFALLALRQRAAAADLLSGALYGLLIYGVNLHVLTGIFPWFSVARGTDTLFVHVTFGVALALACRALRASGRAGLAQQS